MKLGLFKSLKANWNKSVSKYTCDTGGESVNKATFASVFKEARVETIKLTKGQGFVPLSK